MVEFIHEVTHLILQGGDFAITLSQLLFLALKIESFLIDQSVKFFDLVQGLRNFKLKIADMTAKIVSFVGLDLISDVETVDLLEVFAVTLTKSG